MPAQNTDPQPNVNEIPPNTVAQRLALLMRDKGINQAIVVKQLGVSRGTVSKWLSDDAVPRHNHLHTLASFFGVSFNWLVDGEEFSGEGLPTKKAQDNTQSIHKTQEVELINKDIQAILDTHSQEPIFRLETLEDFKTDADIRIPFSIINYPSNTYIQKMAAKGVHPTLKIVFKKTLRAFLVRPERLAHTNADLDKSIAYQLDSDNMQPRIMNNALCFADPSKRIIRDGKVYLIRHGYLIKTCYLKRNADGSLVLINHNKAYPDETIPVSDLHTVYVVGWVFMSFNTSQ